MAKYSHFKLETDTKPRALLQDLTVFLSTLINLTTLNLPSAKNTKKHINNRFLQH